MENEKSKGGESEQFSLEHAAFPKPFVSFNLNCIYQRCVFQLSNLVIVRLEFFDLNQILQFDSIFSVFLPFCLV